MSDAIPRPQFDPEIVDALAALTQIIPSTITADMIPGLRQAQAIDVANLLADRDLNHREVSVTSFDREPITLSVLSRKDHAGAGAGIYHAHPGGTVLGDRFAGMAEVLDWVEEFDAVAVTVEYRLAPEFPDPHPLEDCYAGFVWTAEHAAELGIDPEKLILAGGSAGGGLAAGTSLLARDRGGPTALGVLLMYPMLDDRNNTLSAHQIDGVGFWDRGSNDMAWDALLGSRRRTSSVSIYAAPARAEDLSGLPATFIDVASAEVFRDEAVAYASKIWAKGGDAELHVVPGGFHGFENVAPHARLAKQVFAARRTWLRRILSKEGSTGGAN